MKIPGLALIIPGIMLSSFVELPLPEKRTELGRNETETTFTAQAISRDLGMMTSLVSQGNHLNAMDLQGRTPLMWAAEHGEVDIARTLLKAGAQVNATDWWGRSALTLALENENRKVVSLLIEYGADISS